MASPDLTQAAELPAVRPLYFVDTFTRGGRVLTWGLWGLVVLTVVGMLVLHALPDPLVIGTRSVVDLRSETVSVAELSHEGRSLGLLARAYSGYVTYVATPLEVSMPATWVWALLQAVAWAALLAAASRIQSFWGYAIYLVVAIALFTSGWVGLVAGVDPYRSVSVALVVAVVGTAFAFRQRWVVWSMPWQMLVYIGLYAAFYGTAYAVGGDAGLHQVTTHAMPGIAAVLIFTLLLVAREPMNLIFLLTTNARQPERRQPLWVIVALALGLLAVGGLALWADMSRLPFDPLVKPVHLLALALVVAVVTGQNVYHQLRSSIPSQLAYVVLVLGCCLLTAATAAYGYATAEVMLVAQLERLTALLVTVIGAFYLVYVLIHFAGYLRRRVNVYYVLMEPPRPTALRYVVVWFLALMLVVYLEGQSRWRSWTMLAGSYSNFAADNALLRGDEETAIARYRLTVSEFSGLKRPSGDWKANYQLAGLLYARERSVTQAGRYYEQAEAFRPFAYARMNHANLLLAMGRRLEALEVLGEEVPGGEDARLFSNQAGIYLSMGEPDSAINALKRAIVIEPGMGQLFANLARVYQQHDRSDVAGPLLRVAATMAPSEPAVVQAAAAFELGQGVPERWPRLNVDLSRRADMPVTTRLNLALLTLRRAYQAPRAARADALAQANRVADALLADEQAELGEALLVKLLAQLAADSLANARSRTEYIGQRIGEVRALAYHALGVYYFGQGSAPMAMEYLGRAARSGLAADSLAEALLRAEVGDHQGAVVAMDQYRAAHPEAWNEVAREVSLIERANGLVDQSQLSWPTGQYSFADRLRQARYAERIGQLEWAVEGLVAAAELDSTRIEPYLLAGRLYQPINDTTALANLREGFKRRPGSPELRVEIARQYLRLGRMADCKALLDSLAGEWAKQPAGDSLRDAHQLVRAEWLAATGQDSAALPLLDELIARHRLDERPITLWLERVGRADPQRALQRLSEVLEVNDRSAGLWFIAAQLNAAISRPRDARMAAEQAVALTWPEGRRASVKAALAPVLTAEADAP